jgi:hypothetical protein
MEEEWKEIDSFPNYQVSNFGNVRNIKTLKILKPILTGKGYPTVNLKKQFKVHRLVAQAFIPNPEEKKEVDHIDNNKINNHISNLRWATPSENCFNRKKNVHPNCSKYKGVYYEKSRNKWVCEIKFTNSKIKKRFNTELEAGMEYHKLAKMLCPKFYDGQKEYPELE